MTGLAEPIYGSLPDSWSLTTIDALVLSGDADIQTGPFGTMLHAESYVTSGTPIVAVKHLGDNRLLHEDLPRIGKEDCERLARYALCEGDIVFGRKGAVDRRAYVTSSEEGWLQGSDCIRARFKSNNINAKYVSYVLGSAAYRDWIERNAHGATMPSLNQEIIGRIPLPLPPLPEQRAITRILSSLDDQIEANRHMNETLETLARAIFKSWFVDFDPVRARAEGRAPAGMDAETASLFPDGFEDEIGEIPTGWIVRPIGDVVKVLGGGTPSTTEKSYWEGGTHSFCTPKDMSSLISPILLRIPKNLFKSKALYSISS
ncbi:MAG TPA: restriction endonuclease subunit S, partial [Methanothrix soehngenii]|nr:restriction endonuclease subunit S [Methanothrix soehngenii]